MSLDKLQEFIKGFSGAVELHNRSNNNGSFIESVCLAASIIDALLRIGIILKHQINIESDELIDELLQQENSDKKITERQIYKIALEKDVINDDIFEKLEKLYEDRNRVIHRYIISKITTDEVLDIAINYDKTIYLIKDLIEELEKKQLDLKVGMAANVEIEGIKDWIESMAQEKHGNDGLSKKLRNKN